MEFITKLLYYISTGLLIPVMVLLLIFFFRALFLIGTFYSTYMQKLKMNKEIGDVVDRLTAKNVEEELASVETSDKLIFQRYLGKLKTITKTEAHFDKLLNDFEVSAQKDLASAQSLAKLGPILGLMGTLIPMGPALVGLASGDIGSMASNMQVAFATTVIGLVIGAVGYLILQIKKRWFTNDLNQLDFVVELMKQHQLLVKENKVSQSVTA